MDALSHASDSTIRAILTALCSDDRVRAKALGYLDVLEPGAKVKARSIGMSQPDTKKRKRTPALSICVQCDEPFYEDSQEKCRYHSGEMEPDDDNDFWADHDENCHGTIDTNEMREAFPDGFAWTCCDKLGSEPGCKRGRHQSNPEKSKKGMWESESENSEEEDDESSEEDDSDLEDDLEDDLEGDYDGADDSKEGEH